jgi:hypothetical protein
MNVILWIHECFAALNWYLLFKKFYRRLKKGNIAYIGIMLKGGKERIFIDYGDRAEFSILSLVIHNRSDQQKTTKFSDITTIRWQDIKFMWTADRSGVASAAALSCEENVGITNIAVLNLHRSKNEQEKAAA